jgi:hypothetical protein
MRACTALVLAMLATAAAPRGQAAAQGLQVSVTGPSGDTLRSAMPAFTVAASGATAADRPVSVGIEVSARADFAGALLFDASAAAEQASFTPTRPLPDNVPIWWRGRARTGDGRVIHSAVTGPRQSASWLALVTPNSPAGTTFVTPRPRFTWRAAGVTAPAAPWRFELQIDNVQSGRFYRFSGLTDTTFVPNVDLESNTSYRWAVAGALPTGEQSFARSLSTFVIVNTGVPLETLLYQNFPNPFPTVTLASTCIWFDLKQDSRVELSVHDVRGALVRRILPAPGLPDVLTAGRYGRGASGGASGCDPRFAWDGTTSRGEIVPAGVYLVRLRVDGKDSFKRALFQGR